MSGANYVYVIRFGNLDHKIGYSTKPDRRRQQLPGAEHMVRVWLRPDGDAPIVEETAHQLLSYWALDRGSERFGVGEDAACRAVECAIAIVESEARAITPPAATAKASIREWTIPTLPRVTGLWFGYAMQSTIAEVEAACQAMRHAGVQDARTYRDVGSCGASLGAALKAVRPGDGLVVALMAPVDDDLRRPIERNGGILIDMVRL